MPKSVKEPLLNTIFSGYIGQGKKVDEFEEKFSRKFNLNQIVSVNSGTSALRLALALGGVGSGSEVISTPYTMVATNTAILEQFAKPIFADIKLSSINIDPDDIRRKVNKKTKAILCVHWGGYPCDMDEIIEIAEENNLIVIEDAAHALGAIYRKEPIGTISDYTAFSFQAIKHITTGDGGMLSIKSKEKYNEALRRRWFGIDRARRKNIIDRDPIEDINEVGYKYHMNDIAATIGIEQLKYFDTYFQKRKEFAETYQKELADVKGINLLERKKEKTHANWMFAIKVNNRLDFMENMISKGIGVVVHNWRNDRYSIFGGLNKNLKNVNIIDKTLVNLPLHPALTNDNIDYIIMQIKKYFNN